MHFNYLARPSWEENQLGIRCQKSIQHEARQDYKLNLAPPPPPHHQYKVFQQLHLKEIIKNLLFISQCVLCGDIFRYFLIDPFHFSSLRDISLICQPDTYMSSLATSGGADSDSWHVSSYI